MQLIGLSSVLRPRQHSIGYMVDGFYKSKDPTNSIEVLKEQIKMSAATLIYNFMLQLTLQWTENTPKIDHSQVTSHTSQSLTTNHLSTTSEEKVVRTFYSATDHMIISLVLITWEITKKCHKKQMYIPCKGLK